MTIQATIKVFEPQLPGTDALIPHLRAIDRARRYTNAGPLLGEFEAGLAARLDLPAEAVACVANGTLGLCLALGASGAGAGGLCMMPAWTFVASAHAAVAAGLTPWFVDCDPADWALSPDAAREHLRAAPSPVAAALPVAPFGAPADIAAWDRFTAETGIPAVIDAAAAFDSLRPGRTPAVVSLHATKALGIGEGGFVASTDEGLVAEVRQRANFGFRGDREAGLVGLNAKLSEYAAAVGLAGLDAWPRARTGLARLRAEYVRALAGMAGLRPSPGFAGGGWVSSTCVVELAGRDAGTVAEALAGRGIESRRWWGPGCHRQPAFADCPRRPLPVTDRLAATVLGLPFHRGLGRAEVARVVAALAEAAADRRSAAA